MSGLILYGPPASGKDTVTAALHELSSSYSQFAMLKSGPGRRTGYRHVQDPEMERIRASRDVVWEQRRYNAIYVIDRPGLAAMINQQLVPVVHLGQVPAVDAVTNAFPTQCWTLVYLWCPRHIAEARIAARQTGDDTERLRIWDTTEPLTRADLRLDTSLTQPPEAAQLIHQLVATTSDSTKT